MPNSLRDFEGRWYLSRVIEDARTGGQGLFEGEAVFTPQGDALRYVETGLLRLDGQAGMTATRVYLWRPDPTGIGVFFEDGRPFHSFDFAPSAQATHWCDPDDYAVRYDFSQWPHWTAHWVVTGPRKDYVMTSRYVSAAA